MKMFRTMALTMTLAGSVLLWAGVAAAGQSRTIEGDAVSTTVTVEAIDHTNRTLTVKNDKGLYETIQAPPGMQRFDELKVGDKLRSATTRTWSSA